MEVVKKIMQLLRSKKGFSSAPLAVVIALAGMMLFVVLWQIVRLITISAAVQSAVIATSVGNYSNVYDGVREGYSGGYRYSGNSWRAAI